MLLTPDQHQAIARRAIWYFDCYFGPPGDSVVFTGDGVEDLESLIARLLENRAVNHLWGQRFLCDVGTQYSDWRPFDIQDVQGILNAYVAFYGTVNKPNVYLNGSNTAIPIEIAVEP